MISGSSLKGVGKSAADQCAQRPRAGRVLSPPRRNPRPALPRLRSQSRGEIIPGEVIAANASEAAHVLDGLIHHESLIDIREHYADTAGAIDHVFGPCHLLGFRFARLIRYLADRRLYVVAARETY